MATIVKRYNNCLPTGGAYTGAEMVDEVDNQTEGILKVTITNPARPLEPMKEYIIDVQPGEKATIPAGLLDRDGQAITAALVVVIVEGSTVPLTVLG